MTSPTGPRGPARHSTNGHTPVERPPRRPSPGPAQVAEPPTERVPVVPATERVPVVAAAGEPVTEQIPVVEAEPRTAAVRTISPDLFTQIVSKSNDADQAAVAQGAEGEAKAGRFGLALKPAALRRTWRESSPSKAVRRSFLAAMIVPAVHVLLIVLGLAYVAVSYGAYSFGQLFGGSLLGVIGWVVAAVVALWVGVHMRAGRLWAAIAFAVLVVIGFVVTLGMALDTWTWIGLSGLPGAARLLLLVIALLLCVASVALLVAPVRRRELR